MNAKRWRKYISKALGGAELRDIAMSLVIAKTPAAADALRRQLLRVGESSPTPVILAAIDAILRGFSHRDVSTRLGQAHTLMTLFPMVVTANLRSAIFAADRAHRCYPQSSFGARTALTALWGLFEPVKSSGDLMQAEYIARRVYDSSPADSDDRTAAAYATWSLYELVKRQGNPYWTAGIARFAFDILPKESPEREAAQIAMGEFARFLFH